MGAAARLEGNLRRAERAFLHGRRRRRSGFQAIGLLHDEEHRGSHDHKSERVVEQLAVGDHRDAARLRFGERGGTAFRRVQQDLAKSETEATLISISVDPTVDTPQRLNDFAAKFKAGPGWTFVTGDNAEITSLLTALGTAVAIKTDHTPMILIGNDATGYWTRAYGLSSPAVLVKAIAEAANHK